jgi:hypothetical protein
MVQEGVVEHGLVTQVLMVVILVEVEVVTDVTHVVVNSLPKVVILKVRVVVAVEMP